MNATAIKLATKADVAAVKVTVSMGDRADRSPAYTMAEVGELQMTGTQWETFRDALARGVKRPTVLMIEEENS